mmetsp:Transcript_22359/g.33033  ORF Transcript_22359/g.33033 Transcript_22359/m.33033 type:complete len:280 (-) Transcript_22359:53-892(-)
MTKQATKRSFHIYNARQKKKLGIDNRKKNFIYLCATVTVFLAISRICSTPTLRKKLIKMQAQKCRKIRHRLVEESKTRNSSFKRYAAFYYGMNAEENPVTIKDWIDAMDSDSEVSLDIIEHVRNSSYDAVFFETKGCSPENWDKKNFEFVIVDAPRLFSFAEPNPDADVFQQYLNYGKCMNGCAFPNLGNDAILVAPKLQPHEDTRAYSHLAAFCRDAPSNQVVKVWQLAVHEYGKLLKDAQREAPVWFSTSGMGIAWLHFRLDNRPKYYTFKPFAVEA